MSSILFSVRSGSSRRGQARHLLAVLALAVSPLSAQDAAPRPRARDLGVRPGVFEPGPLNAITDVAGVRVGQVSLIEGSAVRTGVTAIVPHSGNVFQDKVAGAVHAGNAFGKLAGSTQVDELGTIETPIVLTNTLAVGAAIEGIVSWTLAQPGNADVRSVNALVGETNDGSLNDIRGLHVRPAHVRSAIDAARPGPVDEGSVGAGTGTRCYGWKCGIGTASRVLAADLGGWTLGVLVQANFGGVLTIAGAPVGRELSGRASPESPRPPGLDSAVLSPDGSCMIVVATDAPIDARDLRRLAARAVFGLARTGASYANGSGDYAIAFSTADSVRTRHGAAEAVARRVLPPEAMSPLFQAALEAAEEAVYNALLRSTTVTGNGRTAEAIPIDRVREILARHGIAPPR
jgi:D-aminopeptidase